MPNITLKDLSIKGAATVELDSTASAAQSAAESAQEQDKVPRLYQQSVREYFNDKNDP